MLFFEVLFLVVLLSYGLFITYSKAVWDYACRQGLGVAAKVICPAPIIFGVRWRQRNIRDVEGFFIDESANDYAQFRDFLKSFSVKDMFVISLTIAAVWALSIADWAKCFVHFLFVALWKGLDGLVKTSAQFLKAK